METPDAIIKYKEELLSELAAEKSQINKSAVFIGAILAAHDKGNLSRVLGYIEAAKIVFINKDTPVS